MAEKEKKMTREEWEEETRAEKPKRAKTLGDPIVQLFE